jgi:two-component sensor histidine kinase/CHASE3 domain sensor protein
LDDSIGAPLTNSGRTGWRQRVGRSMMPVLLALTVTMLALAAVIAQTVLAQQEARRRAMGEGDAIIALQQILVTMVNAESGQRGYLLTQNKSYLQPYEAAKQRLDQTIASLRRTTANSSDAEQDVLIDRIEKLAKGKFVELDRTVEMADGGFADQAIALVRSDIGKIQMDALRGEISRLGAEKAQKRRDAFARATALENRLLPLIGVLSLAILGLVVAGFRIERSRARSAAEAEQASALREANDRAQLLARELNHRVKNLFSVILSIVTLSARKQAPTAQIVEDIRARIHALSRAHVASQGKVGEATVRLGDTIDETMKPYADAEGRRVRCGGPEVELPVRMVTPIGLIIHELATNAAKYGALTTEVGSVEIAWDIADDPQGQQQLTLSWMETGGPALSSDPGSHDGTGFGSRMTVLAASQLGGRMEREWPTSGAIARLIFPIS